MLLCVLTHVTASTLLQKRLMTALLAFLTGIFSVRSEDPGTKVERLLANLLVWRSTSGLN